MKYAALLRGINVGGSGKLAMPRLREIAVECGLSEPRTYIQSGNLVFAARAEASSAIAERLEAALEIELGAPCPTVVVTGERLAQVRDANPYLAKQGAGPQQLHVSADTVISLLADSWGPCWRSVEVLFRGQLISLWRAALVPSAGFCLGCPSR